MNRFMLAGYLYAVDSVEKVILIERVDKEKSTNSIIGVHVSQHIIDEVEKLHFSFIREKIPVFVQGRIIDNWNMIGERIAIVK